MDSYPKTHFIWSPETEIERVVFTSRQIACGFYRDKGFVVVPELVEKGSPAEVVLPEVRYSRIDKFWQQVLEVPVRFEASEYVELIEPLAGLLKKKIKINEELIQKRKLEWREVEREFWEYIQALMPEERLLVDQVEVRLTKWGTVSSYLLPDTKGDRKLICYVRSDVGVGHLAEIIMTALLSHLKEEHVFTWSDLEAVVDFMVTRSRLKSLFPNYRPTLNALTSVSKQVRRGSEAYIIGLKVVYVDEVITKEGGRVLVNGKSVEGDLSRGEKAVLDALLENKGDLVSFDEVADVLWGEGEYQSLWALNKAVQRLRKKLGELGLPEETLRTVRKRGYVLQE